MPPPATSPTAEAVLEHLDWVQRLAQRLCKDACLADDVTQEAVLAAVRQSPPEGVSLRRWLAGIVRNRTRHTLRAEQRRRDHEALATPAKSSPSAHDVVERVAMQRHVVDAVLALDEPYRSTLLHRFFEEQSPARIAKRTGVPVTTVKTRLQRGLARLRERLDGDFGSDGRSWAVALVPILPKSGVFGAVTAGVFAMALKPILVSVPLVITAVAVGVLWKQPTREGAQPEAGAEASRGTAIELAALDETQPLEASGSTESRSAVAATSVPISTDIASSEPASDTLTVVARVVDLQTQPVAGVEISFREQREDGPSTPVGTTDAQGYLNATLEREDGYLVVDDANYQTLIEGAVQAIGESATPTIVVAPPRRIQGRVVDANGEPLPNAALEYTTTGDMRALVDIAIDRASRVSWKTSADSAGHFSFDSVPEIPDGILLGSKAGFVERSTPLDDAGTLDVEVVLDVLPDDSSTLFGQVFYPVGYPAADVLVSLGYLSVRTDEQGTFQLELEGAPAAPVLQAVLPGYLPARMELEEGDAWPRPLRLVLGSDPLSIEGRVLDGEGEPLPGVRVSIADTTTFGWVNLGTKNDENYMGMSVERLLSGADVRQVIETDERGAFRIEGLLERDYRIKLIDPQTLQATLTDPVAAGSSDLEFVLPAAAELTAIAGRVVDTDGEALEGMSISLNRNVDGAQFGSESGLSVRGPSVQTDANGAFDFDPVIADGLRLYIYPGPTHAPRQFDLTDFADPSDIEIELTRNAQLQVDLGTRPELADSFELRDASDNPVGLTQTEGLGSFTVMGGWFDEGRTGVFTAPEGKFTLVLLLDDEEVERVEVELVAGETRRVDF